MINIKNKVNLWGKEYENLKDSLKLMKCFNDVRFDVSTTIGEVKISTEEAEMFIEDIGDIKNKLKNNPILCASVDPVFDPEELIYFTDFKNFKICADNSNWCIGSGWAVPYKFLDGCTKIIYFINVQDGASECLMLFRDCDGDIKIWDTISADKMPLEKIVNLIEYYQKDDEAKQKNYIIKSYHETYQLHSVPAKSLESALKQLNKGGLKFNSIEEGYVSDSFTVDEMTLEDNYGEELKKIKEGEKTDSFCFKIE